MPIINSTHVIDQTPQADGRRWVKETHIDHNGNQYFAEYLASEGFDYDTCLAARASNIGLEVDSKEAAYAEASKGIGCRRLRPDAFRDRFNFLTEKIRAKTSPDPVVQLFYDEINGRPYIDLDHPLVQQAMPYLRDTKHPVTNEYYLDGATPEERQARMDTILADGDIGEI